MARIRCPHFGCGSTNCVPLTQNKKYKVGKGIVNGAIGGYFFGPLGAVVGASTGFNGKRKVKFLCQNCGNVFVRKI